MIFLFLCAVVIEYHAPITLFFVFVVLKSANQRSKIKKSYLSFYRFLCETPLKHEALDSSCTSGNSSEFSLADGYDTNIYHGGTYHQQYRLCTSKDSFDGPLVAVGVIGKSLPVSICSSS